MPAKNRVKNYLENGFYHIYNRGVEKRNLFVDETDERVFLNYLKSYLLPKDIKSLSEIINNPDSNASEKTEARKLISLNNYCNQIDLLAFCLMPNHFHLLIKQKSPRAMEMFMKSFATRYVQYFNHRHEKRVGSLFQDIYKAVLVSSEEQLLYLTKYIHRNPKLKGSTLKDRPGTSSYLNYLGLVSQPWIKPEEILAYFRKKGFKGYEEFVEETKDVEYLSSLIQEIAIE